MTILYRSTLLAALTLVGSALFSARHAVALPNRASGELKSRDYSVNVGFPYGQEKIRGVNLGGWLVLEPFITPEMFSNLDASIVDEWTFCANQDRNTAAAALKSHWDSFITQDDFNQIAAAGLNHVRLPIGFWAFDVSGGEPYIQGAKNYLYDAIGWARSSGLKLIIDLHGAPGSQNGYDNSGHRGAAEWATQQSNIDRTKAIIQSLAQEFSDPQYYGVVTALAVLNEPAGYLNSQLLDAARQFTIDAYYTARYPWAPQGSASQSGLLIVYHDAFQPSSYWDGVFVYPKAADVALDTHIYEVFSQAAVERTWGEHLSSICSASGDLQAAPNWPIVGEWTLAAYDCAQWLNGRGVGARYDGTYPGSTFVGECKWFTGDGSLFSSDYKNFLRTFWDTQTQTYENNGQGWIFWTWKAPNAVEWSYQDGLRLGWIPQNPTSHLSYTCS